MITIQNATLNDWPSIKAIYIEGIETGHATFVTACGIPSGEEWFSKKIDNTIFKAMDEHGEIVGWAALQAISGACSYAGVAEVSVYVSQSARGQGVGKSLLQTLIEFSEDNNIWTLQASIFPENIGSMKLHQTKDFTTIGRRKAIGQLNGSWRDEILLERRSTVLFPPPQGVNSLTP